MKQWELQELVEYMRSNKVARVKLGALEVDLSPQAFVAEVEVATGPSLKPDPTPTDSDMLFWSSPVLEAEVNNGQA